MVVDAQLFSYTPPTNSPHIEIYDYTELYNFVNRTVTNYYYLNNVYNLDFFSPKTYPNGTIYPIELFIY